jgi:hypothetical protein
MDASLDTLVVAAYVFADAFAIPRSGPRGKITDAELIALAVAQAVMGCRLTASSWAWWGSCCRAGLRICPTSRSTTGGCAG